jgi:radical SAM superfamily enzyme YgiQ (UPF0313 family)
VRVLLLNGPIPYTNAITHIPLELAYIARLLIRESFIVKGLDFSVLSQNCHEQAHAEIREFQPEVVFTTFSRVLFDSTRCLSYCLPLLDHLRRCFPTTHICAIGEHATFRTQEILDRYCSVDSVIRFAPELAARALCRSLTDNQPIEDIPGVVTKRNPWRIEDPSWHSIPDNLDVLSIPERKAFPVDQYLRKDSETIVEGSRGCVHRCLFCQRSRYHRKVVERGIDLILKDVAECHGLGFNSVFFTDLDFCRDTERAIRLCNAMISERIGVTWTCNIRADITEKDSPVDVLRAMKAAGCYRVFVGLESPNPGVLSNIRKRISPDNGMRLKRALDSVGLKLHASFLVGTPKDNFQTLEHTFEYAKALGADMTSINALVPLPGTEYGDSPIKWGIDLVNGDTQWYERTEYLNKAVSGNANLSPDEIDVWLRSAHVRLLGG